MRYSTLFTLAALAVESLAAPASSARDVLHEKRDALPPGWTKSGKVQSDIILPIKIALKQSNLHQLDDLLMDVSHPDSANYGKHWTHREIADYFKPSKETHDSVREWLSSFGITGGRAELSKSHGWVHLNATVAEAESLFGTEYFYYEHSSGESTVACEEYHLPEHITEHIDFVKPTVHFDTILGADQYNKLKKRQSSSIGHNVSPGAGRNVVNPGTLPKIGTVLGSANDILGQLQNCSIQITLICLRALYLIPFPVTNVQKNAFGIVEYTPESYLQSDLDLFFNKFQNNQVQRTPIEDDIDGGYQQTTSIGFGYQGEPDLDLEYAMGLANPISVTLYQVGDTVEGASFNNFLDAIDGSYCTYMGGDDPTQDGVYPDPYGGYQGPEACGTFAPTKVISTSYGYNEADLTPFYENRQCQEYAKLGLGGSSIFYSSGDYGVAGNGGQCINPDGTYNNGANGRFNPSFPGTCPYVTSVGATQIKPGASVLAPEEACETVIYSGGGFSNVFPIPSYQSAAVASYFKNYKPAYGADRYNNSMKTRGFPDISANGANYVTAIDGKFALVYGTSASCPVVASIFTIINEARAVIGKSSVGFVNPTLYAHPSAMNDITSGGNQGCGTPGFTAVPGWDPVTGLGTPNTPKLLAVFLGLP